MPDRSTQFATFTVERDIEFPPHTLLNVNIPNLEVGEIRGIVVARQGIRHYENQVLKRTDPRGKAYYWIGGGYLGFEKNPLSDCHAVNEGYVSVTPITIDCTHNEFYTTLQERIPKL